MYKLKIEKQLTIYGAIKDIATQYNKLNLNTVINLNSFSYQGLRSTSLLGINVIENRITLFNVNSKAGYDYTFNNVNKKHVINKLQKLINIINLKYTK